MFSVCCCVFVLKIKNIVKCISEFISRHFDSYGKNALFRVYLAINTERVFLSWRKSHKTRAYFIDKFYVCAQTRQSDDKKWKKKSCRPSRDVRAVSLFKNRLSRSFFLIINLFRFFALNHDDVSPQNSTWCALKRANYK